MVRRDGHHVGVNAAYRAMLTRRALSHPLSSSGVLTKARALAELERAEIPCGWDRLPDERREQIRAAVLEVIAVSERLQSFDGNRAASIAIRLLGIVDGDPIEDEEVDHSGPPVPIWLNEQLDQSDRESWLPVMLSTDMEDVMRHRHGWRLDWMRPDGRAGWIVDQAAGVMASEDPIAAAAEWLRDPPTPPKHLAA
jgi:hypothetical protein